MTKFFSQCAAMLSYGCGAREWRRPFRFRTLDVPAMDNAARVMARHEIVLQRAVRRILPQIGSKGVVIGNEARS